VKIISIMNPKKFVRFKERVALNCGRNNSVVTDERRVTECAKLSIQQLAISIRMTVTAVEVYFLERN
jgi:hypothetical protein